MKIAVKKNQQRLEEEKLARKQLEGIVSSLQGRLSETEERARKAEQTVSDTKSTLAQLVHHTQNVQRSVASSQQGLVAKRHGEDLKLQRIINDMEALKNTNDRLEKTSLTMRNDIQDLRNKMSSNGKHDFENQQSNSK